MTSALEITLDFCAVSVVTDTPKFMAIALSVIFGQVQLLLVLGRFYCL